MPIRVAREDMAFGGPGAPECRPGRVKAVVAAMGWLMRDKQGGANTATAEDFGDLIRLPPPARINGEVNCPGGACGRCLSQGRRGRKRKDCGQSQQSLTPALDHWAATGCTKMPCGLRPTRMVETSPVFGSSRAIRPAQRSVAQTAPSGAKAMQSGPPGTS